MGIHETERAGKRAEEGKRVQTNKADEESDGGGFRERQQWDQSLLVGADAVYRCDPL